MSSVFSPRCVFAVAAASSLLAGCATIYPDSPPGSAPPTPPELQVRGLRPPLELTKDSQPYSVEIKNGAGDVLYSGEVGKIERRVPLWKLDGTLVISTIWTNRTTTTQTLKSPPEKPVEIVYDPLQQLPQRRYVLVTLAEPAAGAMVGSGAPTSTQPRVTTGDTPSNQAVAQFFKEIVLRGGYGELSDKAPTWGVTVGAETPLQKASKKIDFYSVEVDVPIKGMPGDWQTQVELKGNWGRESTGLESAVGSRGQAFQGGFHGGTGGFASNAPSSSHVETKYNEQSVTFAAQSPLGVFNQSEYSRITKELQLTFDRIARRYDSTFQYPAIPGLAGNDDQRVRTLNIGAGFGAFGTHRFDNGFSASLGGRINLNVVSGHYSGTHHYTNPLAAPVNQDFTQTTWNNGGCDLTWSGRAFGELGYRPDRRTEWLARFAYNYLGNGFALQNKVTPDDPTPYLVNAGLGSWKATLGVRYTW